MRMRKDVRMSGRFYRSKVLCAALAVLVGPLPIRAADPSTAPASQPTTLPSKISLNFKDAPLDTVLTYLSQTAGFSVLKDGNVDGRISLMSVQPVSPEEAVTMLNAALKANGFTVTREDKLLHVG